MPLLQADDRIARIVGIARRPFDPAEHGWTKMTYRQGDVRDPDALEQAFADADVVVHLAFMITGTASRDTIRAINVEGTLNTFRAAAAAGARRFVYASSVAAYGFSSPKPGGVAGGAALRLRVVRGGLRLPSRQPGRDDGGMARAPRRPALLRPGEGGDRAPAR